MAIAPESASPRPEGAPSREGLATREQVMNAFNNAAFRWATKIYRLRKEVNPPLNIDIDDLADTNITPEQRDELGRYRNFEKGSLGLAGGGSTTLTEWLKKDTITTHFKDPDTNEVYQREEGLDVSDLIDSAREDIKIAEGKLRDEQTGRYPYEPSIKRAGEELARCQTEARILEENSVPRSEVFPHDLDENDPVGRARVAEEARRVYKNPLTSTGSIGGDRQAATARLRKARLLVLPKRVEKPKEPAKITKEEPKIEEKPPVAVAPEPERVAPSIAEPVRWPEAEIGKVWTPPFTPGPDLSGKPERSREWRMTYPESLERFFGGLKESGPKGVSEVAGRLRKFGGDLKERIPDPEIKKKVEDLMGKVKIPEDEKNRRVSVLALAAIAAGLTLATLLSHDSFPRSASGKEGPTSRFPSGQMSGEVPTMGPVSHGSGQPRDELPVASVPPRTNVWELNREASGTNPPVEPIKQVPSSQPELQGPGEPLAPETPMDEVEIQPGQRVRRIIEDMGPENDPFALDRAASVGTFVVWSDNPDIENIDEVKAGQKVKVRKDLADFMKSFNPNNPVVDELNGVANTPEAIEEAKRKAVEVYEDTIRRAKNG